MKIKMKKDHNHALAGQLLKGETYEVSAEVAVQIERDFPDKVASVKESPEDKAIDGSPENKRFGIF